MANVPQASDTQLADVIRSALVEPDELQLVIVFGSIARGTSSGASDVDVALDAGHRLTSIEKMTIIAGIAQETGRPVDLSIFGPWANRCSARSYSTENEFMVRMRALPA